MTYRRFLFKLLLFVIILSIVANISIESNRIFLSGEFMFSFDYLGHVSNLITNYITTPGGYLYQTFCQDCPAFYHFSSWFALWVTLLMGLGQLLGYNPFVFRLLLVVLSQLAALYLFVRLNFKNFNPFVFVIASQVFIFIPHKIYLMPNGAIDGLNHALMIAAIAIFSHVFKHIPSISSKTAVTYGLCLGLILSPFLNLAVSHLPLIVYSLIVVGVFRLPLLIHYRTHEQLKVLYSLCCTVFVIAVVNAPFILSQLLHGNVRTLTDFYPLTLADSLTAGATMAGANITLSILFFISVVVLLLIAQISFSRKLLLVVGYLSIAFVLIGAPLGKFSLYGFAFDHLPLMNHMRGVYKLLFFQHLLLFTTIFLGLDSILQSRTKRIRSLVILISIILLINSVAYIQANSNLFHSALVSEDYFQAAAYLDSKPESKIYFPAYWSSKYPNMSGNYTWLSEPARSPTLYTNPFTSLFLAPNLINFEQVNLSLYRQELRSLIDYSRSPMSIVRALEYTGVKYLILDDNYFWQKNFPDFEHDSLSPYLRLDKKFGQIAIFQLPDERSACQLAWGDFRLGYCHSPTPKYLINRSPQDYFLETFTPTPAAKPYRLPFKKTLPNFVVNVPLRLLVLAQGFALPSPVFQIDNDLSNIIAQKLSSGKFKLFIPVFKLSRLTGSELFMQERLEIYIDGKLITEISPYSDREGLVWEELELENISPLANLSISAKGPGILVLGQPLLIPLSDWINLKKSIPLESSFKLIK